VQLIFPKLVPFVNLRLFNKFNLSELLLALRLWRVDWLLLRDSRGGTSSSLAVDIGLNEVLLVGTG
jgi:hypothetical protein